MKTMQKIVSMLLVAAIAVSFGLAAFAAAPAPFENSVLNVTGDGLKDKEVTIIRVFTAKIDDKNANGRYDSGETASYVLEDAWKPFFNTEVTTKPGGQVTDTEAYEYIRKLTPEEKLVTFAKAAKDHYLNPANKSGFSALEVKRTAGSNNTATFTGLKSGYYLVLPAGGSTGTNRASDAMLVNVVNDTDLNIKTEYPTVDKTIVENGADKSGASARIGEILTFRLTAKVPNMAEFKQYYLNFKDTASAGLTPDKSSIKVSVISQGTQHETVLTKGTHYTETIQDNKPEAGKTSMSIVFADLKKTADSLGIKAGDTIQVEYKAMLNETALTVAPNTNTAQLEYSTNPEGNEHGESNPSETKTYTFGVEIHKYADSTKNVLLPGAVFQLFNDPKTAVIQLYKVSETEYRAATQAEIEKGTNITDSFETVAQGNIVIKGLKEGRYLLEEATAPSGYNKLTKPVEFEIAAQYEPDGSLSVGYPKYSVGSVPSADAIINVQNKNGTFLPETGSIGTIGLTIAGAALIIGGIGFGSRRKKEQE